jgi:hypothetical protein
VLGVGAVGFGTRVVGLHAHQSEGRRWRGGGSSAEGY